MKIDRIAQLLCVLWAALGAACYSPTFHDGLPCSESNDCPADQSCDLSSGLCRSSPGGVDAASGPDAMNPSCPGNGPDPSCPSTRPVCEDGRCTGSCVADADCAGRAPSETVCHAASGACGQCDEGDAQATPGQSEDECPSVNAAVCDGDTHTCRACESHSECFSHVCDVGRCVPPSEVIYMSANGTDGGNNNCDNRASGMGCLTLNYAIGKLTSSRKYIFLEPNATPYPARNNTDRADFSANTAIVIGYGASIRRIGADGEIIEVHGSSNVTFEGVTIEQAGGATGHGIKCDTSRLALLRTTIRQNGAFGILGNACNVEMSRSTISGNRGGGVSLSGGTFPLPSGSFKLVNNFIVGNGDLTSTFGGLNLNSTATVNSLEFNTIALNQSQSGYSDGITCSNAGLVARNNIVIGSATKQRVNSGTNCTHRYTLFTPDSGVVGEGNMTVLDQGTYNFVSATDFHIGAGSVAAGKGQSTNLAGETLFDIDGDARTANGTSVDVGADEIP